MVVLYGPDLDDVVDSCRGKDVALFYVVHGADPALRMGFWAFEDRFCLLGVPDMHRTVLASSHEPFLVDCSHSIDCIVVTFVYNFGLFLCLPGNHLLVVARSNEVVAVEVVQI